MAKAEIVYLREQNAQLQSQIQSLSANMADTMEGDGGGMLDDIHGHHDKEDFVKSAQLDITTSKMEPQWVTGVLVCTFNRQR